LSKANQAGLKDVSTAKNAKEPQRTVISDEPVKEVVTEEIAGIEIFDLDDAVTLLKSKGVYAESGMGCTGPVVLVNDKKHEAALEILKAGGFVGE